MLYYKSTVNDKTNQRIIALQNAAIYCHNLQRHDLLQ